MAIDKLKGHPYSDVPSWCFEKEKKSKKDPGLPMRPSNTRTDKETEMPAGKVSVVLDNLVKKVNVMIEEIAKIPPLEEKILELEAQVQELTGELHDVQVELTTHKGLMGTAGGHMAGGAGGGTDGGDTGGGRKGGSVRTLQTGGDIKQKQSIIAKILKKLNG